MALADGGGLVSRRLAGIEERGLAGMGFDWENGEMGKFENVALADWVGLVSRRLARIEERGLAGIGFRDLIM